MKFYLLTFCAACFLVFPQTETISLVRKSPAKPAPWYTIDLDEDPYNRWQHVARNYNGSKISEWISDTIKDLLPNPGMLKPLMLALCSDLDSFFSKTAADEMRGLSKALKIELYEVVLINIVYDFTAFNSSYSKVCTSIVAEDKMGNFYHGRNLDYHGPSLMRDITVQLNFIKNGSTLFKATSFVGYIGIITGVRPGAFSISGNERDTGHGVNNIFSALLGGKLDFWNLRKVLEEMETYDQAMKKLSTQRIIAPVYYIVGGVKPGQGAIIVRDPGKTVKVINMRNEIDHPWFVLETNYDPWNKPPASDNRRDPGIKAMMTVSQAEISAATLYQVLSVIPVMNDETVYTTIMSPTNGTIYETMIRHDAPHSLR